MNDLSNVKARAGQVVQAMHDLHKEAWDKLDKLEALARKLADVDAASKTTALQEMEKLLGFMESSVLTHFKEEEDQVCSVLRQILPPNRRRSVTAIEKDHHSIGDMVAEIKSLLRNARCASAQSPDVSARIAADSLRLVRLMRDHINKENLVYQELGEMP